ncbi:hypothetical protein [Mucilaginibacter terrae]|uniref:Uncharacterized protein n=1 Tax=Mucilaginibacter terrae TaxID=1955052 RepID=A0ABU3GTS7_9SPHI|nr:hypothetical protein [Mucilaginibacter terrae]MDT3402971.1 hypothetical protein [Mucilaginibacter terrae]
MNLFKRQPKVKEIALKREYVFMYENFLLSTQHELYLALEKRKEVVSILKFKYRQYKYGYPNDEAGHPYMDYGLGFYGFFEVHYSPWANCLSKIVSIPSIQKVYSRIISTT